MKKVIVTAAVALLSTAGAMAQTFLKSELNRTYEYAKLSATEEVFYALKYDTVYVLNMDLTPLTKIAVPLRTGEKVVSIYQVSRTLFDADNGIEFVVSYADINTNYTTMISVVHDNAAPLDLTNVFYGNYNFPWLDVHNTPQGAIMRVLLNGNTFFYRLQGQALGIKKIDLEAQEALYPNPTKQIINISGIPGEQVFIYDMNGKVIQQERMDGSNSTIDVDQLNQGTYIVKTSTGSSYKFVKE